MTMTFADAIAQKQRQLEVAKQAKIDADRAKKAKREQLQQSAIQTFIHWFTKQYGCSLDRDAIVTAWVSEWDTDMSTPGFIIKVYWSVPDIRIESKKLFYPDLINVLDKTVWNNSSEQWHTAVYNKSYACKSYFETVDFLEAYVWAIEVANKKQ